MMEKKEEMKRTQQVIVKTTNTQPGWHQQHQHKINHLLIGCATERPIPGANQPGQVRLNDIDDEDEDGENEDGEEKMRMMEHVNQVQGVF